MGSGGGAPSGIQGQSQWWKARAAYFCIYYLSIPPAILHIIILNMRETQSAYTTPGDAGEYVPLSPDGPPLKI